MKQSKLIKGEAENQRVGKNIKKQKMTNKKPTTEESISNAMKMLLSLRGQEITSTQFTQQCRKFKVRDGLLRYCVERRVCDKRDRTYYFPHNLALTPRLVKFILDISVFKFHLKSSCKIEHLILLDLI